MEPIKRIIVKNIPNIYLIGNVTPNKTMTKNRWKLNYTCDKKTQTKENGRVYFIVVNDEIYKIGQSSCKGGIKSTFNFYQGGLGGSPSLRSFGIHMLIQNNLEFGNKIEIYALFNEAISIKVNGISSIVTKDVFPDVKEMEDLCREDYKKIYSTYPPWNFQENGEEWPYKIKSLYKQRIAVEASEMLEPMETT
jgi:hypothetical protein